MAPKIYKKISIVIPVLNEESNISELIKRIHDALIKNSIEYELIFIDDFSTDNTISEIKKHVKKYPVTFFTKQGKKGKAESLLEGFSKAKYEVVGMIDSDLQYAPETIPSLMDKLNEGHDIVIAERKELHTNTARKVISRTFNFLFCKLLHGVNHDVQSGLKIFKKEIIDRISIKPLQWSFDLEFLLAARSAGYKSYGVDITFEKRTNGESKVNLVGASTQIGLSAILLKLKPAAIVPFLPHKKEKVGQGFNYKGEEFIHFSDLHISESAVHVLIRHQAVFLYALLFLITIMATISWVFTLTVFISLITIMYFSDLLFYFYLIYRSFEKSEEIKVTTEEIEKVKDWPTYTIFCPLYNEWKVVNQFVKAIGNMDYPKDKLQVQLLLEEDDVETIAHIRQYQLPKYFEIIVVPNTLPKTKPKACNYGLKFAKGEYAVIYDAEDIPDPLQLKKAVVSFQKSGPVVACMQAKLNYYNRRQNLLTRLFTAEYTLWFDLILTGLQSIHAPIPLGGTSNHFKVDKLKEVHGWDSFNVTEDCDLGIRLAKKGYRTAIMDSVTLEEANSSVGNWLNQRSRWIKGYIQTYLVHMRNPKALLTKHFKMHFLTFQLIVGGKILSLFINPFMWLTTLTYFLFRSVVGETIEKFFPGPVFYIGVVSLLFGNFLYMYYYMIACVKRKQYDLIKYVFVIPFYWLGMSLAAWMGLIQLINNPHYWPKTKHGLHLEDDEIPDTITESKTPESKTKVSKQKTAGLWGLIKRILNIDESSSTWNLKTISSGTYLAVAIVGANFLNFLFSTFFGRILNYEDFGLLTLVNTLSFLISLFFSALTTTINHKVAYLSSKTSEGSGVFFLKETFKKVLMRIVIFSLIWAILTPFTMKFFHLTGPLPILILNLVIVFGVIGAMNDGFLSGSFQFRSIAILVLTIPVIKLLSGFILQINAAQLTYLAIPFSLIAPVGLSSFFVWRKITKIKKDETSIKYKFPTLFYFSTFISSLSISAYITIDILLVQHYLPEQAGQYALLAFAGKMIYFLGGMANAFMVGFVSRDIGNNINPSKTFDRIFLIALSFTLVMFVMIGVFGHITLPILFGEKIIAVLPYILVYSTAITFITLSTSILIYHLTLHHYSFPIFTLFSTSVMLLGIIFNHNSIEQVSYVLFYAAGLHLTGVILLHLLQQNDKFFIKNIIDLFCHFVPMPKTKSKGKNRILIFNWRDIKHTYSGGAEVYIHELAKRWVKEGHEVTVFCGNDGRNLRNELVDGVEIIRRGGFYTVYVWALLYYIFKFRNRFDIIIDCENGIPFFTPLYSNEKIYLLIHHVHQEIFRTNLIPPFAKFATFLEIKLMPFVYRHIDVITVSQSSKDEIMSSHLSTKEPIIIYNGIDLKNYQPGKKSEIPTVLYVGRLKKYKSIHVLLTAAKKILESDENVTFIIAGSGEEKENLERLTKKLGIEKSVQFLGKISDEQKLKLYQEAWVFVQPSFMEGWSLTTLEACACGTPIVASNVPGLKDAVKHNENGLLTEYGNHLEFAENIWSIIENTKLRNKLSNAAVEWAKNYDWKKSSDECLKIFNAQNDKK